MKCDDCGSSMKVDRKAVRRYVTGGLPHVELHGVEVRQCEACGNEELAIPRIGQLHRLLANTFVRQARMLAPIEIRFLRKHVGLSTGDFAEIMGVSRETVSRWETGANAMGATADRLLRLVVISHEPTESYAVEDLLRSLNDVPVPEQLSSVSMCNSGDRWLADVGAAKPRKRVRA